CCGLLEEVRPPRLRGLGDLPEAGQRLKGRRAGVRCRGEGSGGDGAAAGLEYVAALGLRLRARAPGAPLVVAERLRAQRGVEADDLQQAPERVEPVEGLDRDVRVVGLVPPVRL